MAGSRSPRRESWYRESQDYKGAGRGGGNQGTGRFATSVKQTKGGKNKNPGPGNGKGDKPNPGKGMTFFQGQKYCGSFNGYKGCQFDEWKCPQKGLHKCTFRTGNKICGRKDHGFAGHT